MAHPPAGLWQSPFERTQYPPPGSNPGQFHPIQPNPAINSHTGMSAHTAERIDRVQTLLAKKLGPEYLSTRQGGGGSKLTYIEGWRVINLANEIFGYNGWYTEIKVLEVDFMDYNDETSRFNIGCSAIVKVWLNDGASHEDVGYGKAENAKSKADALDKCKKEAVTDGLKRALRNFGSLLGNCLYDKAYTNEVGKMKAPKAKFDFSALHRPDSVPPIPLPVDNAHTPAKPIPNAHAGPSKAGLHSPTSARPVPVRPQPVHPSRPAAPPARHAAPPRPPPVAVPAAVPDRGGAQTSDMFAQLDDGALEGLELDASIYAVEEEGGGHGGGSGMEVDDSGFAEGGLPEGWNEAEAKPLAGPSRPQPGGPQQSGPGPGAFDSKKEAALQRKREKQAQKAAEEQQHREKLAASAKAGTTSAAQILAQDTPRSSTLSPAAPKPGLRPPQPPPRANSVGPGPIGATKNPATPQQPGTVNSSYPGASGAGKAGALQRSVTVGVGVGQENAGFTTAKGVKRGIDSAGLQAVVGRSPVRMRGTDLAGVGTRGDGVEKLQGFKRAEA